MQWITSSAILIYVVLVKKLINQRKGFISQSSLKLVGKSDYQLPTKSTLSVGVKLPDLVGSLSNQTFLLISLQKNAKKCGGCSI